MEGPVRFAAIIAALGPLGYGGGAEYGLDPVSSGNGALAGPDACA